VSSTPAPKTAGNAQRGGVAVLSQYYYPNFGGAGVQAQRLTAELRARGWTAFVVTTQTLGLPRKDTVDGTLVLRVPVFGARRSGLFSLLYWLGSLVLLIFRVRRWSLLHVHGGGPFVWLPLQLARLLGRPVIVKMTLMGNDDVALMDEGRFGGLSRAVFEQADAVISISRPMSDAYRASGLDASKLHEMPQGVDVSRYRPASADERAALRRDLGLAVEAQWLVCVGAVFRRKGTDIAVDAFIRLAQERPDLRMALVGIDDTTPHPLDLPDEREFSLGLKRRLSEAGLSDRVIFSGVVENVEDYLRAADIFLFPSHREGFGTVMVEAMACGLPSVVNSIDGIADTVYENGRDGIVLDEAPASDWAREIATLLDDPERAGRMGAAARVSAELRYNFTVVSDRYDALYTSLLDR
jgi:glycosyltransferase involved in cell wall biosynthesis